MSVADQTKSKMTDAIEHLKHELKSIRTNRANPSMLDNINVEVYGTQMRIKDLASITSPDSRQLVITPFDHTNKAAVAKSIEKANVGVMPIVDGNVVRLKIPPMDESLRKEMIKLCAKRCEEAKISIRNERRHSNDLIRKQKNEGLLAEDEMKKIEKIIQELTDKFCKEADEITVKKEKEVSTI